MKQKNPFYPSIALFFAALVFCVALRVWLKLNGTEHSTGFYKSDAGFLDIAFNIILFAALIIFFVFYLFRDSAMDYPVYRQGRGLAILALLTGLTIILYQIEGLGILGAGEINPGVRLERAPLNAVTFLGQISAFAFIMLGIRGLISYRGMFGGALPLISGVWMMTALIVKFNSYTTLTTISDNMLAVLFMLFCSMFLVGHARTLSGLARGDGRNYTIPTGFCAALCGFLLVAPNWLWAWMNETSRYPALLLGTFESWFVFCMSVYAICFVLSLTRGIKKV